MLHAIFRHAWLGLILVAFTLPAAARDEAHNVYRFRSDSLNTHFYTISADERDAIRTVLNDVWHYEGADWSAYPTTTDPAAQPVYRFFRAQPAAHFYTINQTEKDQLIERHPQWRYEGIAWYAYPEQQPGTIPVFRFWIPGRANHFYTADFAEHEHLVNSFPEWIDEGIAWYSFPARDDQEPIGLVRVNGGCYDMGNTDPATQRPWICVDDFMMGRFEVTQAQWARVMGENPARWFYHCPDCPVETMTWHEVQDFIHRLNELTGRAYRLPTEAEWEYACRSGGQPLEHCGADTAAVDRASWLDTFAWFDANSGGRPHPVGSKVPNELGLYDMSGNVWEWTCTLFESAFFSPNTPYNRECASQLSMGYRVIRGGSWQNGITQQRSDERRAANPETLLSPAAPNNLPLGGGDCQERLVGNACWPPAVGLRLVHDINPAAD